MGGKFLKKEDVKRLSDLPARDVILAQIIGSLKAPATRIARSLTGKQTDLILLLKQLSEKKGGK
jgi:large subunit ribosomal protein L10